MRTNDDFFGGPATFSFKDDVRLGVWCGGVIVPPEPFTQQTTKYKTNEPDFWDPPQNTRPKQQLQVTLDTLLGKVPERADANDPGQRRLFIRDSGDLNKAVKAAVLAANCRKMEIGGQLYFCNTGKRPNEQGGSDARTFQAVYAPPEPGMIAQVAAKYGSGQQPAQQQVLNIDDVPKAPAPPTFTPTAAPAAPTFPGQPQYQPTTYQTGGQSVPVPQMTGVVNQPGPVAVAPPGVDPNAYAAFLANQQAPAPVAPGPAPQPAYVPPAAPPMPQYGADPAHQPNPFATAQPAAPQGFQPGTPMTLNPISDGQVPPPAWAQQPAANSVPPNPLA